MLENIERLKRKYYYDIELYDKLCALSYLQRKNIIPIELEMLYSSDITELEENLIKIA